MRERRLLKFIGSMAAAAVVACSGLDLKPMPLDPVCKPGGRSKLDELLAKGGDINESDGNGDRPVSKCVINGEIDTAVELVRRGAKLDFINVSRKTFLAHVDRQDHIQKTAHLKSFLKKLKEAGLGEKVESLKDYNKFK